MYLFPLLYKNTVNNNIKQLWKRSFMRIEVSTCLQYIVSLEKNVLRCSIVYTLYDEVENTIVRKHSRRNINHDMFLLQTGQIIKVNHYVNNLTLVFSIIFDSKRHVYIYSYWDETRVFAVPIHCVFMLTSPLDTIITQSTLNV